MRESEGLEMASKRTPTIKGSIEVRKEQISRVIMLITKNRHSLRAYTRSFLYTGQENYFFLSSGLSLLGLRSGLGGDMSYDRLSISLLSSRSFMDFLGDLMTS